MEEGDDENINTLLCMGFPDVAEIKRALRLAKNDLNEAVAILTNEQPLSSYGTVDDLSLDVDMKYQGGQTGEAGSEGGGEGSMEFPVTNLYELDSRVFQDNWSIPYKREESLGKCLVAATKLAAEGLLEQDEHCKKFIERVMPEAFRKLLTSHATHRWQTEIQEGILLMCELFIELLTTRMQYDPVPCHMLNTLALIFDTKNDWNHKNKDQGARGRWHTATGTTARSEYAKAPETPNTYNREQYGWLCDLINQFGDKKGFSLIEEKFEKTEELTARAMAALLHPLANCANLLLPEMAQCSLSSCMEFAFKFVENLGEQELKSKDINYVSDLCYSLKVLCCHFWPQHAPDCDKSRLEIINRMLRTPHFTCRMNGLKEVSRLIEEAEKARTKHCMSQDAVLEWMSANKVLSVALEGNIDQVQYTDRIKAIVEFLGPRLSAEELTNIWNLGEGGENSHVQDNVHGIISAAASKFSLAQFELLNRLIKEKWAECNDRSREKLLLLIGQIGKEAVNSKQVKPVQAILQLLWDMAHIPEIPKHLVERAFAEHLATINEMTLNKDAIRRQYVLNCVDDIKRTTHCVLPAVKQLYAICKSYSGKSMSMYNKANKATLGELNKQHEIVKLLSTSLNKSHAKGVEVSRKLGLALKPDTMVDGRYTHREYVEAHLELMMFLLKEGDLYLSWSRCKELWETLVDNPNAIQMDQDSIFVWFTKCLSDLEPETQKELFNQKLLSLPPNLTTEKSFSCLKAYFESVNVFDQRLKKSPSPSHVVERTELAGLSHFWDVLTDSPREEIAALAIDVVLNMSYLHVTPRLKKDPSALHHKFIRNCYSRLEVCRSNGTSHEAVLEGCELETSTSEMAATSAAVASTTKTLTAISVSKVPGLTLSLPSKGLKLQKIRRLLLLAEKYILSIEVLFDGQRTILPHGASFFGRPISIQVRVETPKREEFEIESHTNESVGEVKLRIAERLKMAVTKLSLVSVGKDGKEEEEVALEDGKGPDGRLVCQVGSCEGQTWQVKGSGGSSSTAVVVYEGDSSTAPSTSSQGASSTFGASDKVSSGRQAFELERERCLPGVLMAEEGKIFSLLYQLAELDDSATMAGIRRLIHLIPTDSDITDGLDTVGYLNLPAAADASPKMSPRLNKKMRLPRSGDTLEKLFDATANGMTPFRVLYNLEVLSSRIMPSQGPLPGHASKFAEDFLTSGGLRILTNVLEKDALPLDIDYDIRQSAYFISLQLAGYLLCGQTVLTLPATNVQSSLPTSSVLPRPTPPKKSALDCSSDVTKSPLVLTASKCVQTMAESEFVDLISCLMRVVWAAAAGKLYLASMGIQAAPKPEKVYIGRRSRDSSTGSSASTGSDTSSVDQSLHAGVCSQQTTISSLDCQIAGEALELFVTCLSLRQNLISRFYSLPSVSDFIIDTLLGSPSEIVRQQAADQFSRLSKIKLVSRALSMSTEAPTLAANSPRHFFVQLLLKTPVPLWMPSCKARTASHQMTSQCGQYMELRCSLLQGMSRAEQEVLGESAAQMIEDEITWLFNFSPCSQNNDATLLAGHIKLVRALLSCQGVNKQEVGASMIPQFLSTYLFPASRLISEGGLATSSSTKDCSPLCDTPESRAAAYGLLVELGRDCAANLRLIAHELVALHHRYDANMVKEHQFEYEPAIERRAACNYVGLKNAGATCYMNSVIQQLYAVPTVTDQLLGVEIEQEEEESVFYQLQAVFGHLLESKLQYFVPDKFWKCFKLWGQPVNVREQQDAFEFFTQIVDQVDEYLHSQNKEKIFSKKFQGVFSDQKICEGCPHRYEREEAFMALNLTIKSNNLVESLGQFVKGELLEGDNAYFCEKCSVKRNTVKRMCVRSLPQTLVIQLKRFHYDWETNRSLKFDDYFEFPWVLDMGPFTSDGIAAKEDRDNFQAKLSPGLSLNTSLKDITFNYDLVGVTVHSGQANAGHYYSFIKDRKGNSVVNPNKNKWFKFNDTTVEEFEMTQENLEAECFGGKFKVKKKEGSNLPEERQRYWNGYILIYEARDDHKTPRTPKKSFSGTSHRRSVGPGMVRRLTMPSRISEPGGGTSNMARESLSQLSDLLEKGEKRGIFSSRMPASIERSIREENLRFMQNRDVFSEDYYSFLYELTNANSGPVSRNPEDQEQMNTESVKLAIHFLFNTYYHVKISDWVMMMMVLMNITLMTFYPHYDTRKRQRGVMSDWVSMISKIIEECPATAHWLVTFLSSDGLRYIKPYLLEGRSRDVRQSFSHLLERALAAQTKHRNGGSGPTTAILTHLVEMLGTEVQDNVKNCGQYFWLLLKFAEGGRQHCAQLFRLGAFEACVQFLTGAQLADMEEKKEGESKLEGLKKWSSSQTREFGDLHALIATLILACDTRPHTSCKQPDDMRVPSTGNHTGLDNLQEMPTPVATLLYGSLGPVYIAEAVSACRETGQSIPLIVDMLAQVSFCCKSFSVPVLEEVMRQYNSISSSELKNLSLLVVELLCLQDPLQNERVKFVTEGSRDLGIDGLLDLVQSNQTSDSCRAYQAVKCLVTASSKCPSVRDHLILQPTKWQWAVNWLKSKMTESSSYWSPGSDSVLSNEESSTRTFHRTTSAQVTLDEANAMLAEFESDKETAMDTLTDGDEGIQMKVDEKDWDLDSIDP